MRMMYKLFKKQMIPIQKIRYPPCGREYCYCVMTTDLKIRKNQKLYHECYKSWFIYYNL